MAYKYLTHAGKLFLHCWRSKKLVAKEW